MKKRPVGKCLLGAAILGLAVGAFFIVRSCLRAGKVALDGSLYAIAETQSLTMTREMLSEPEALQALSSLTEIDARQAELSREEYLWLCALLPGVQVRYMAPLSCGKVDSYLTEIKLPGVTAADAAVLKDFPALTLLDCSGSRDYALLLSLKQSLSCRVTYTVPLGEQTLFSEDAALAVAPGFGDMEALNTALTYLPAVKSLDIRQSAFTNGEIAALLKRWPALSVSYFITVLDEKTEPDTKALDLTGKTVPSLQGLIEELSYLSELKTVALTDCSLNGLQRQALMEALPDVDFGWTYVFLGETYSKDIDSLDLNAYTLTDNRETMNALAYFPALKQVDMCQCGLDDTAMAELADAYPKIKFIWEIDLGFWGKLRTDATAYTTRSSKYPDQMKNRLHSQDIWALRYCTELVALDLGHQQIQDISPLSYCTKLQVLILADNQISDLTPLKELTELRWVELFMNRISDLTPLSGLVNLRDLNLCTNRISDLTPLYSLLGLRRLWYSNNAYTAKDARALSLALIECNCNRTVWDETADGWRETEEYYWMRSFFADSPRYK